jgi:hypothetical protein
MISMASNEETEDNKYEKIADLIETWMNIYDNQEWDNVDFNSKTEKIETVNILFKAFYRTGSI